MATLKKSFIGLKKSEFKAFMDGFLVTEW